MAAGPTMTVLPTEGLSKETRKVVEEIAPSLNQFLAPTSAALAKGLTISENLDAQVIGPLTISVPNDWHEVGATGEPAFENSWVNYDSANFATTAFRKHPDGTVEIKGLVKDGSAMGTSVFTLPSTYRPALRLNYVTDSNNAYGRFDVYSSDGTVRAINGTTGYVTLHALFTASDRTPVPASCWPRDLAVTTKRKPIYVAVAQCIDKDDPTRSVYVPTPSWVFREAEGRRFVRIKDMPGLAPNRTYLITFVVYGG